MRIPGLERRPIPSRASAAAIAAAATLLVGACDSAPAEEPAAVLLERAVASAGDAPSPGAAEAEEDCLARIWRNQADADEAFDRANDAAEGGTISCATGTSATRYAAVIEELRTAAAAEDRATLLRHVSVPLLYIDSGGERRTIDSQTEAEGQAEAIFTPGVLDLLARIELEQMTVAPGEGGYFALGALWLTASREGGNPRIVTINQQALTEAAAVSERSAAVGQ